MRNFILSFVLCAGLAPAQEAIAATRTVCASGCGYTTIQAAVDAANSGDLVLVTDAFHTEANIFINKSIELAGAGNPLPVVQAAATPQTAGLRILSIMTNTIVTIRDLVLRHGEDLTGVGGAIRNEGILTLRRVEVVDNWSGSNGGGIGSYGPLVVEESVIARNEAPVGGGIFASAPTVISASEFRGNLSTGPDGGGAIRSSSRLLITETDLIENTGIAGGAIYGSGRVTMVGCAVAGNVAVYGGGLFLDSSFGWIESSIFENNRAEAGGAIYDTFFPATVRRSIFRSNSTQGDSAAGGALLSRGTIVEDSLFHGNATTGQGGAIYAIGEFGLALRNSTVSGNQADFRGGGVYFQGGGELSNVTITDNDADPSGTGGMSGGGIYSASNESVTLRNSIIAGNRDGGSFPTARAPDCAGEIVNNGWSSIGTLGLDGFDPACVVSGATPDVGADPGLAPLTDNGGPTLTHALLISSPNIDTGDPAGCLDESGDPIALDQRGGERVETCDRGAFENLAELAIFTDDFELGGLLRWDLVQ